MERAKSHAELPADESTGEQGQEIESKEEPTTSNGPRPAMAMEREKDWPIDKAPASNPIG